MCYGPFCKICNAEIYDETCGAWEKLKAEGYVHDCVDSLRGEETYHLKQAFAAQEKIAKLVGVTIPAR